MSAMKIDFPDELPQYCEPDLVLMFPASIDGKRVVCAITVEALEDHFGARSMRAEDAVQAFLHHRPRIEQAARAMLEEVGGAPVVLHSGFFRFFN